MRQFFYEMFSENIMYCSSYIGNINTYIVCYSIINYISMFSVCFSLFSHFVKNLCTFFLDDHNFYLRWHSVTNFLIYTENR